MTLTNRLRRITPRRGDTSLAAALVLLVSGCFSPPLVQPGGPDHIDVDLFPPGTELIELAAGDENEHLRGVWIPGDDDAAAVVLYFMASGSAISSGWRVLPRTEIVWDVRDRGLALLAVDYRGVGASDGKRHASHVREDARVAWDEAVRRAGDSRRVVLRGNSLGALAVASLLEDGAAPAGVVLAAPILDDTILYNVVAEDWGGFAAWMLDAFVFRDPVGVDLVEELARLDMPRLVVTGDADDFIGKDGRERLVTLRESGAEVIVEPGFSHIDLGIEGGCLLPLEGTFYASIFPASIKTETRLAGLDRSVSSSSIVARWRMDPPRVALELAKLETRIPSIDLQRIVDWYRDLQALPATDPEALAALFDFRDSAGPLDESELEALRSFANATTQDGRVVGVTDLAAFAMEQGLHKKAFVLPSYPRGFDRCLRLPTVVQLDDEPVLDSLPPRLRLSPQDSLRHVLRLLLKCRGIPERTIRTETGALGIEWRAPDGEWRRLHLPKVDGSPLNDSQTDASQ